MSGAKIQLVTFDLYDTLIELHPPRWKRLGNALLRVGIDADLQILMAADLVAEDFYTAENTLKPIRDRGDTDRKAFRLAYMTRWLEAAGIDADESMVRAVREHYIAEYETPLLENPLGYGYRIFPDVLPALKRLREAGVKRAVISNADDDITNLCAHMAFAHDMNVIVTSAVVGFEKPDVRTFQAALEPLGVEPFMAMHIGDQPRSDVVGALASGMHAALIDRYQRHPPGSHSVPVFNNFDQLVDHVLEVNSMVASLAE